MNERIRELAEQAGYTKDIFGIGHWDMPECKKFAELLVRECINTFLSVPTGYKDYRSQIEEAMRDYCVSVVKQHFGVK